MTLDIDKIPKHIKSNPEKLGAVLMAEKCLELSEENKKLKSLLVEYEKPKNWTRGYNYKGELVKEFALYVPKLRLNKG